jgi:hypothetical protein
VEAHYTAGTPIGKLLIEKKLPELPSVVTPPVKPKLLKILGFPKVLRRCFWRRPHSREANYTQRVFAAQALFEINLKMRIFAKAGAF